MSIYRYIIDGYIHKVTEWGANVRITERQIQKNLLDRIYQDINIFYQ